MITLYVKTHKKTGIKYFGKTCGDPYTYLGSGKYWKRLLEKHGNEMTTEVVKTFEDHETATALAFAVSFSMEHDIVKSDAWANLKMEELDGGWSNLNDGSTAHLERCSKAGKRAQELRPETRDNLKTSPEVRAAAAIKAQATIRAKYGVGADGKSLYHQRNGITTGNSQSAEKRQQIAKTLSGFKTLNNGELAIRVKSDEVADYLNQGWKLGRLKNIDQLPKVKRKSRAPDTEETRQKRIESMREYHRRRKERL